jgi:hypothetical protein
VPSKKAVFILKVKAKLFTNGIFFECWYSQYCSLMTVKQRQGGEVTKGAAEVLFKAQIIFFKKWLTSIEAELIM